MSKPVAPPPRVLSMASLLAVAAAAAERAVVERCCGLCWTKADGLSKAVPTAAVLRTVVPGANANAEQAPARARLKVMLSFMVDIYLLIDGVCFSLMAMHQIHGVCDLMVDG